MLSSPLFGGSVLCLSVIKKLHSIFMSPPEQWEEVRTTELSLLSAHHYTKLALELGFSKVST